jgi:hypothetical protein
MNAISGDSKARNYGESCTGKTVKYREHLYIAGPILAINFLTGYEHHE